MLRSRRLVTPKLRRAASTTTATSQGRLAGKIALVTGSGGGIGAKSSILFAKEGATVICADLNLQAAEQTAQTIIDNNGTALAVAVDVADANAVAKAVHLAETEFGALHVIFNNAGVMLADDDDAVNTENHVWDKTFDINVKGVWHGCKFGIPALRRAQGGAIVNTASFVGLVGAATPQLAYTASKGAVLAMTRELAIVHARENIRVNALCPGPLNTPLLQDFLNTDEKQQRRLVHVPMGRFGEAAEMAKAALFLASDDASYVTGANFLVDGGLTAGYVTAETRVDPFSGPKDL